MQVSSQEIMHLNFTMSYYLSTDFLIRPVQFLKAETNEPWRRTFDLATYWNHRVWMNVSVCHDITKFVPSHFADSVGKQVVRQGFETTDQRRRCVANEGITV